MFKTKKVKRFKAYIGSLEKEVKDLEAENERLKATIKGDRVCGGHCQLCCNAYEAKKEGMRGNCRTYKCKLDIKCRNFKGK